MKVFVTGAEGFIGSHLVESLIDAGYKVTALCLYNSFGSYGWLDTIPKDKKKDLNIIFGDIRDPLSIREGMRGSEIVFHLAALIAIPYSYVAPSSYVDTNVKGTLNVLQIARELDVSRIIHTSTSETYGSAQFVPINETHPLIAQSPYAASKIGADQMALSYWKTFSLPVTILRPFNTYGPRQSNRAVIPQIITQIAKGQNKLKLGSLSPTRDFNFVKDTCAAFIAVANSRNTIGEVINSASNFEISIGKTAELISEVMNSSIDIESEFERIRPEKSEVNRLYGCNKKIISLTDWRPKYDGIVGFREGLRITVDWFMDSKNLSLYSSNYMI
tara:strand:+ start:1961 stop:2953 length:993 start_codon:yes stop_codon:yes gene_type:complete